MRAVQILDERLPNLDQGRVSGAGVEGQGVENQASVVGTAAR